MSKVVNVSSIHKTGEKIKLNSVSGYTEIIILEI